jgi:quercetin dioxygenase-like cupin family protein
MLTGTHFAHMSDADGQEIWPGLVARSVHGERSTFTLVEFQPGVAVPEHAHDNEQIGMLVAGSVAFTIAGETRELRPGSTWRIGSHEPHSARAGDDGAVIVEVFTPHRGDWAAIEAQPPSPPSWPG